MIGMSSLGSTYLEQYNQLIEGLDLREAIADRLGETYPWSGVDHHNIELMDQVTQEIERHRKGDFELTLIDSNGNAFEGSVEIEQVEHAFKFGANSWDFNQHPSAFSLSSESLQKLFNSANVCNYLNAWWRELDEPYGNWSQVRQELEWCGQLGLDPRFHIIQYVHMKKPGWWRELDSEEKLWDFYTKRVADVADQFEGEFFEYDVMNEMIHWPYWFEKYDGAQYGMTNLFAFDWMRDPENGAKVVRQAREYLPDAKLVVLETGIWNRHPENTFAREIHAYFKRLIELDAPFDVIGYQGRYEPKGVGSVKTGKHSAGERMYFMESIDAGLEWFSELGKQMAITEFSMPSRRLNEGAKPDDIGADRNELALWVANFHILAFSKPYINQVTWWNVFRREMGWIDAGLINRDGSLTEVGQVMDELINRRWHTQWKGQIKAGRQHFRGFYGDYLIRIEGHDPQTVRFLRGAVKQRIVLEQKRHKKEPILDGEFLLD